MQAAPQGPVDPAAAQMRQQLCDDAINMLVLWATRQEYDPGVEKLMQDWATTLCIPQEAFTQKVDAAMSGALPRPLLNRYAAAAPPPVQALRASFGGAAAAVGSGFGRPAGGGGGGGGGGGAARPKRPSSSSGDGAPSSKKSKSASNPDLQIFAGVSRSDAMVGRKVKRFWPDDASRNKGDPWFTAVVTDYDPSTRQHVLTYSLGTQREEREDVVISMLAHGAIDLGNEWIDLEKWYADPKRREKSFAVKLSRYLRARAAGIAPP